MKISRILLPLLLITALISACAPKVEETAQPSTAPSPELEAKALAMVENLSKGDYAAASIDFDDKMLAALPGNKLQETWEGLLAQTGSLQNINGTYSEAQAGYQLIYITCAFENAAIDIRVAFDSEGKIAGMFFQPAKAESTSPSSYNPPSYVQQNAFQEKEVTVGSGEWALPGTLTMPNGSGPFPAVVLVHGSGPNDRDETVGPNKIFKDIAWGLASRGIAVLRYDKRTYVHSGKFDEKLVAELTVQEETIDDALAALNLLRQSDGVDPQRVYLLGHSLGATLAPRIVEQDSKMAGIILLAGITRPMEDVALEQVTYLAGLDGEVNDAEQENLDAMQTQVANVKEPDLTDKIPASDLPLGVPAAYWLDLRPYQPAEVAKTLTLPMLILQGERDYQVTMTDFAGWQAAVGGRENVTLKSYPGLNHLFIVGEGAPNPQEYNNPGHVSDEVIQDIAVWLIN